MVRFVLRPKFGKRKVIIFTKGGFEGTFSTRRKAQVAKKIAKGNIALRLKIVKIGN